MSVPQMPTRWTRTRASPGPGLLGAGDVDALPVLGRFQGEGFHGVRSLIQIADIVCNLQCRNLKSPVSLGSLFSGRPSM